ncbi:hypothetical protein GGI21_000999 [Coemansia aciculifera]|nr:hypothetical protein GGI21_000999 [Coemansia aciculifera]
MGNHMSFSVTQSEQIRVLLAAKLQQDLDPRQAADLIMVIVISCAYFIQLLAVIYMLWNRAYPPIKAKNPGLMTCVFVSSIMWFTGDIQANGHAPLKGTPLQNCKAFGVWVRVLLGVCGMSALIGLRSYGLYRVFCRNLAYRGLGFYIPFIIASAFMVIYGIVLQALPDNLTIVYMGLADLCYYNDKYKASLYALLWVTWVIIAALNWCTRNIKSSFNETRELLLACIMVFSVLTFMTVLSYTHARYPVSLTPRILATSLDQFAATTVWWLMMAVPLFKCLTDRQRYLKEWIYKLRADGLQQAYHIEPGTMVDNDNTSGGNLSYLHPNNRKYMANHQHNNNYPYVTTLVPTSTTTTNDKNDNIGGKEQQQPEFFYGGDGKDEKYAFPHISSAADTPNHGELPLTANSNKRFSEGNSVRWAKAQPMLHSHKQQRPWNKLTSAVNNFVVPSFTSNPVPPIPMSPLSPVLTSAAAQPYTPIPDYPESSNVPNSSLLRLGTVHDLPDSEEYGHHSSRQLI